LFFIPTILAIGCVISRTPIIAMSESSSSATTSAMTYTQQQQHNYQYENNNNPFLLRTLQTLPKQPSPDNPTGWIIEVTEKQFPILAGHNITFFESELFHEGMIVPVRVFSLDFCYFPSIHLLTAVVFFCFVRVYGTCLFLSDCHVAKKKHWHPDGAELGYVVHGKVSVSIWLSPGDAATAFTVEEGQMWFIPQNALHCINPLVDTPVEMLFAFSASNPGYVETSLLWDGIPLPILRGMVRDPVHDPLVRWWECAKVNSVQLVRPCPDRRGLPSACADITTPYRFDFAAAVPLEQDKGLGETVWAVADNWSILKDAQFSLLRATSLPHTALAPIWWPNADSLFALVSGEAEWTIIDAKAVRPVTFVVKPGDLVFVPRGYMYTYRNLSSSKPLTVLQAFNTNSPALPVWPSVANAFMPLGASNDAMRIRGQPCTSQIVDATCNLFGGIRYPFRSPFFIRVPMGYDESSAYEGKSGAYEGKSGAYEGKSGAYEGKSGAYEGKSGAYEGKSHDAHKHKDEQKEAKKRHHRHGRHHRKHDKENKRSSA